MVLLVSHVEIGHAHADLLAAIPTQDHVPGDGHHDSAGGSCDGLKAPAHGVPAPTAGDLVPGTITPPIRLAAPFDAEAAPDRPPLFLLHAALLI